jgi:hypothetical protein
MQNVLSEKEERLAHLVHLLAAEVLEREDEGLGQAVGQSLLRVGNLLQRAPEPRQQRLQIYTPQRMRVSADVRRAGGL